MRRAALVLVVILLLLGAPALAAPTDPFFPEQWGFQRIGAEFAWAKTRGAGPIIAVVDTGVDLSHEDLRASGRFVRARDFTGGNNPQDVHGHGTLVTGAAAALSNNGIGVASVAPEVQIMPLRIFNEEGTADPDDAVEAIDYAVDQAADLGRPLVLNLSFAVDPNQQGPGPLPIDLLDDPRVDQAIESAAARGAAVAIAAGNENAPETAYDAEARGVLVVGSTDRSNGRASFSNYGAGLDIVAPGVDILSTYWKGRYASASGTSMSVPLVAGTAALLMADGMSNVAATDRIISTARDLGPPGRDDQFGGGLLDTAAALGVSRQTTPPPPPPPPPAPLEPRSSEATPIEVPTSTNEPPQIVTETSSSPLPEPQAVPPGTDDDTGSPAPAIGGLLLLLAAAAGHVAKGLRLI